jgi:outer membrane protein OmpA-like peptidoglycan-associated protein
MFPQVAEKMRLRAQSSYPDVQEFLNIALIFFGVREESAGAQGPLSRNGTGMGHMGISAMLRALVVGVTVMGAGLAMPNFASAQQYVKTDKYKPALGVTPDGCQVWLIDDGWEGYAWNRTDKDGKPVCVETAICFNEPSDNLFDTDSGNLRPGQRERLTRFFQQDGVYSYAINGYTDARASYEYNIKLSKWRATTVAKVAQDAGANVTAVRAYGEQYPRATNSTREGLQQNRRVEIFCHRNIGEY